MSHEELSALLEVTRKAMGDCARAERNEWPGPKRIALRDAFVALALEVNHLCAARARLARVAV